MARNGNNRLLLLTGFGLGAGAGLMYLLDPDQGRRRRALLRDKATSAAHRLERGFDRALRDLDHRAHGLVAETRAVFRPDGVVPDDVLESRIHAEVGRVVSHPGAIYVSCTNGSVILAGLVLKEEVERLKTAVRNVKGVGKVNDWLCEAETAEHVSSLQGGVPRLARWPDLLQPYWSPATRFLAGATGTMLSLYAFRESGWRRLAAVAAGAALLTRAASNRNWASLAGFGGEAEAIKLQKTIRIDAPLSELFEFWANPKNYPKVFAHVQEVRKIADNLYRWQVAGPAGTSLGWEGTITRLVPNQLLEWKSTPGSMIGNWGVARFDPNYDGSTRLHIQMSYEPPAGLLGHLVAEVFGADPKSALDDDLSRLKSLFEHGKTRVHGTQVTRESLKLTHDQGEAASPLDLLAST